jgi:chemotaxis protein MotB
MTDPDAHAPIIVKKVRKHAHDDHHGGAWKVAYADFVTAMMAFFLLLWLLSSTSEEQRIGLADYFAPAAATTSSTSGAGGVLGGQSLSTKGAALSDRAPMGVVMALPGDPFAEESEETPDLQVESHTGGGQDPEAAAQDEDRAFETAARRLNDALDATLELAELADNLIIDETSEGLRIQLVDEGGAAMFQRGSAEPRERMRKLMALVVSAIRDLPNPVAVTGHTDAAPFRAAGSYDNWSLWSDRALASRRGLIAAGLNANRIVSVVGKADQGPLLPEAPLSERNRRISLLVLRTNLGVDRPAELPVPTQTREEAWPAR